MNNSLDIILTCCGRTLITIQNFDYHYEVHTSRGQVLPFPHPECSSTLANRPNLNRHIDSIHPDIPPYFIGLEKSPRS